MGSRAVSRSALLVVCALASLFGLSWVMFPAASRDAANAESLLEPTKPLTSLSSLSSPSQQPLVDPALTTTTSKVAAAASGREPTRSGVLVVNPASVGEDDGPTEMRSEPASSSALLFASFSKAKHQKLSSSGSLPRSRHISGFGDTCASTLPNRDRVEASASRTDTPKGDALFAPATWALNNVGECLRDDIALGRTAAEASAFSGHIKRVAEAVRTELRRRGWGVEVWYMAGRRPYLAVTHPLLRMQLHRFGGVADKIMWLHQSDQQYVPRILASLYGPNSSLPTPEFEPVERGNIRRMYRRASIGAEAGRWLYVKVDDDTVYLHPGSITLMVAEMLEVKVPGTQPTTSNKQATAAARCTIVSGNVVNHVGLHPVHDYVGAFRLPSQATVQRWPPQLQQRLQHRAEAHPQYRGYTKDVSGSFAQPVEWLTAHLTFLSHFIHGTLDAYFFARQSERETTKQGFTSEAHPASEVFDFNCDGHPRRWGINLIAFPSLGPQHFGAMRGLGHTIKNKDEIYFSMHYARNTRDDMDPRTVPFDSVPTRRKRRMNSGAVIFNESGTAGGPLRKWRTCAVGGALAVHYLMTAQASQLRRLFGITDDTLTDASFVQPYFLPMYRDIARHVSGVQRCCRRSGCSLFRIDPLAALTTRDLNMSFAAETFLH